jgi:valacyclovir hydrolase
MPFIDLSTGANFHYETWNDQAHGTPVVVLHGMLGTATVDLEATNQFIAELGFRVVAPTLRGYGESTPKPRDFPTRFYDRDAEDVMAFMDALHIEKAHLLGYSDGGEITLINVGKHPHRFASGACWGAVGYFGEEMRPVAQRPRMLSGEFIHQWEIDLHQIPDVTAFGRGWVRSVVQMIDAGGDVSLSLAHHITCPLLIMLGDQDTLNPPQLAQRFLEKVPNGRLEMFSCGHAVHTEQTEAFRTILKSHLLNVK